VDFDFNVGSDHEKLAGTNGFSIQWRGSLVRKKRVTMIRGEIA